MPALFFDEVTLVADGLRVAANGNAVMTFAALGLANEEPLLVHARQITIEGAPADRRIKLVTDLLVCPNPTALHLPNPRSRTAPASSVEILAQRIDGALSVQTQGRTGATGATGAKGTAAVFEMETVIINPPDEQDPNSPVVKPTVIQQPKLITAAGQGRQGKKGGQGESGPSIVIRYVEARTTPVGRSKGGDGGPGGKGGPGGSGGQHFPDGPPGVDGSLGDPGISGPVSISRAASAQALWQGYLNFSVSMSESRAQHDLRVAEYHYRLGTADGVARARSLLEVLAARPGGYGATQQNRARTLLRQIGERSTYLGLPRDLDVTPDVAFAAKDNPDLLQTALTILGAAHSVIGASTIELHLADTMDNAAAAAAESEVAAELRIGQAASHLGASMTSTDIARGRIANLDQTIQDLKNAIDSEADDGLGFFELAGKIVTMGAAIAGAVAGIATGVGAVVAVGAGVAVLKDVADGAVDTFDMIEDIKSKLDDPSMKSFVTGLDDLGKVGKSFIHLGKVTDELLKMGASHPAEKIRELARLQRDRILLLTEVGLHQQMEQEAQLGQAAATADKAAITRNKQSSEDLAKKIRTSQARSGPVLESFLVTVRQVLEMFSVRLFNTLRAREIYRGDDATAVVRHDLGHLHPDVERVLGPADALLKIDQQLRSFAPTIIEWSSLLGHAATAANLSQTPVPFSFTTDDPEHLASLRSPDGAPQLGFFVDPDDVAEQNGSQIFEARFDRVKAVFHGARINNGASIDSVKLTQFGHWSMRRRPDAQNPDGTVKTFSLPNREVQLTAVEVGDSVEATFEVSVNPDAVPPFAIWGRGIAGNWRFDNDGDIDFTGVTSVEVVFIAQALSGNPSAAKVAGARTLRPLAGWPPAPVAPRSPTPIPKLVIGASYAGSVAAVGAGLL
jgi:hypothetical protein